MAVAYVDSTASYNNVTCDAPTGSTGDILVNTTWDITAGPAGWSQVSSNANGCALWIKTRTGAEPATYTFTAGAGGYPTNVIYNLTGTTAIGYGIPNYSSGTDTTADNSGVTAANPGLAIYFVLSFGDITAGQSPGGMTERELDPARAAAGYTGSVSAGATGSRSVTVVAADYRTLMLVMEEPSSAVITNRYSRVSPKTILMPGFGINTRPKPEIDFTFSERELSPDLRRQRRLPPGRVLSLR